MLSTLLVWLLVCSPLLVYSALSYIQQRKLRRQLHALRILVESTSPYDRPITIHGDVYRLHLIETEKVLPVHRVVTITGDDERHRQDVISMLRTKHLVKLDRLAREKMIVLVEDQDPPSGPPGFHFKMRSVVAIPHFESWPKESLPAVSAWPQV